MSHTQTTNRTLTLALFGTTFIFAAPLFAATDRQGNVGYSTAAECDAAVAAGSAKFYEPFTDHPPLKRDGEVAVKQGKLSDAGLQYGQGACDLGVGRSQGRDGVSGPLIGKFVPYSPDMPINLYSNAAGKVIRVTMQKCDNNFGDNFPRPIAVLTGSSDCFANIVIGPRFETKTEQVVKVPVTKRFEVIPATTRTVTEQVLVQPETKRFVPFAATMKTVTEQVLVSPETKRQVPVAATYKTVSEQVLVQPESKRFIPIAATFKTVTEQVLVSPEFKRQIPVPATFKTVNETIVVKPESFREEPIAATYKNVTEQVLIKPESKRIEVVPGTFKTASEQVMVTPERKELKVIPAVYGEVEETVIDKPAMTRTETIAPTFRAVTESVLVTPESLRYEPIQIPLRVVSQQVQASAASARLEVLPATYKTVTERMLVREASKRLETVPAVFETITERVKVSDATREWKKGSSWISKAINVRPASGFTVGADGKVDGVKVDTTTTGNTSFGTGRAGTTAAQSALIASNAQIGADDEVYCLVEIPEQYQTISRQVLKTAAAVREVEVPAQYSEVSRQVLDRAASSRSVDIPGTFQTVTRQEIDVEKLRAGGYKFDDKGDLVAMPNGDRILRAASIDGWQGSVAAGTAGSRAATTGSASRGAAAGVSAATAKNSAGAASGIEGYVREVKVAAVYKTETRQAVDRPATVRTFEVPATFKTVKTRVVTTPARTEEMVIRLPSKRSRVK